MVLKSMIATRQHTFLSSLVIVGVAAFASVGMGVAACGDDEAEVRERLDSGALGNEGGALPDSGVLACGVLVPTAYVSAAFATNAAAEIGVAQRYEALRAKMIETEGATGSTSVTTADLKNLYSDGAPSLRAIATPAASTLVDSYFDEFGAAIGKTWTPALADQDGGAATGGKYENTFTFSATGVDLRAATEKALLGGALYNHVLGIVAAPITEASVDRLVAAFGATPAFAGGSDDKLIAEHASKRDDKTQTTVLGPYRKIRNALLNMKAAAAAPDKCKADLDAAVASLLLEWERATYASAIYALSSASTAAADPTKGPAALHFYGDALGFVQSFKGVPQEKRKITDAQIDVLVGKMAPTTAWKLVTNAGDRALKLSETINDIALYEGFQTAEVEAFKKSF